MTDPHDRSARIFVAGHRGMVGSALVRRLTALGYTRVITRTRAELDLERQAEVEAFFDTERPDHVFLAAAKVGGIQANQTLPAAFIHQNLVVQCNVIHAAWKAGVKRLMFLGSSCIYPRDCPQPMREAHLLTGPLEPTNEPYAIAKIAGIKMCESYNRQYGTRFVSVMPTNLYGPNDHYDLEHSHVLPALIRKAHEARVGGSRELVVWGSGRPRREFLYVDDMAAACVHLMQADLDGGLYNIGAGNDMTIREAAQTVMDVVGFAGELRFDDSRPDGTPRKLLDVSALRALGWQAQEPFRAGLEKTYADFVKRYG